MLFMLKFALWHGLYYPPCLLLFICSTSSSHSVLLLSSLLFCTLFLLIPSFPPVLSIILFLVFYFPGRFSFHFPFDCHCYFPRTGNPLRPFDPSFFSGSFSLYSTHHHLSPPPLLLVFFLSPSPLPSSLRSFSPPSLSTCPLCLSVVSVTMSPMILLFLKFL